MWNFFLVGRAVGFYALPFYFIFFAIITGNTDNVEEHCIKTHGALTKRVSEKPKFGCMCAIAESLVETEDLCAQS